MRKGIEEKFQNAESGFDPPEKYGIKVASMSLFDAEWPTMWRGPLIHNAIMQLTKQMREFKEFRGHSF